MVESRLIVDRLRVAFEGIFSVKEVISVFKDWMADHGYDVNENHSLERITKDGKYFELGLKASKNYTDYISSDIFIGFKCLDIKNVVITKDNLKIKMQQGSLNIEFSAFLNTDYEGKWETRPIYYFLKIIYDKFIGGSVIAKYENQLVKDVNQVSGQLKSYLNLYKIGDSLSNSTGIQQHL